MCVWVEGWIDVGGVDLGSYWEMMAQEGMGMWEEKVGV
jgi:hypothetical protein